MKKTKEKEKTKYIIECDEDHVKTISQALDYYSRLGGGQLELIIHDLFQNYFYNDKTTYKELDELIHKLKLKLYGLPINGGFSIHDTNDLFRICYDIHQVLRHRIAWDRNSDNKSGVDFYEPIKYGSKSLVKIIKVE